MKKALSILLVLVICLSLCACGEGSTNGTEPKNTTPTVESIVAGIKYEFKDPDSVQMTDVHIARVKVDGGESKTEFYAIGTVRAKNSFGGYADPVIYIIHCDNGRYEIVGEYTDASYMMQTKFNELGCGASWSISAGSGSTGTAGTAETFAVETPMEVSDNENYIGVWANEYFSLTINEGGVGRYDNLMNGTESYDLTWEVKDEVLTTQISFMGMELKAVLELNEDGTVLNALEMGFPVFIDGETEFTKK